METHAMAGSARNVLLVEDDLAQQKLWALMFHKISNLIRLESVTSAEAALSQLTTRGSHKFDLVLCDIYLEGAQTGVDLQKICAKKFPKLPFILTSSLSTEELAKKFGYTERPPRYVNKRMGLKEIQAALRSQILEKTEEGILPSAPQLLAGIGVALGLTVGVIQNPALQRGKPTEWFIPPPNPPAAQLEVAPVAPVAFEVAELQAALEDQDVQKATKELLSGGLTPWMNMPVDAKDLAGRKHKPGGGS